MGFFGNKPKKRMGCLVISMSQTHGASIYPITIPMIHICDWDAPDNDGDGYRYGSLGDSD